MNQHFLKTQHDQYSNFSSPKIGGYSLEVRSSSLNNSREIIILWYLDLLDIDQHKVTSFRNSVAQTQLIKVLGKRIPSLRVRADLIGEEIMFVCLFEACGDCFLEWRVCAEDDSG
jgi:hypothetical protein